MSRRNLALALFTLALLARVLPGPRTIDDAFITFRYAQNLLSGAGFVYNAGEHVLGTTTPLFTLLLSTLGVISGGVSATFPWIASLVAAVADAITAVLLFKLGERLGWRWVGIATALIWCVAPYSVTFAVGGLETSFYVLLLVSLFYTYIERRFALAAGLAAAALLTRPDALLLIAPLAFDRVFLSQRREEGKVEWREALAFAVPIAIWGGFAWAYFGSPIPQSLLAKSAAYRLEPLSALVRLLQHYATPFLEHLTFGSWAIRVGVVVYPALALIGGLAAYKRNKAAWPFAIFAWVYFVVFAIANPLIFRWYLTTPLPFYFLFIFIGIEASLAEVAARWRKLPTFVIFATLAVLAFISTLRGWTLHPVQPPNRPAPEMAWIELELLYEQAASKLAPYLAGKPNATVAAGDVGVLGYTTGARILDLVGLNSAETLPYYPLDPIYYGDFVYAVSPDQIAEQQPDFIVILEIYGRFGLLKDARFTATYELLDKIETNIYGSHGLLIYQLVR